MVVVMLQQQGVMRGVSVCELEVEGAMREDGGRGRVRLVDRTATCKIKNNDSQKTDSEKRLFSLG